MFLLFFLFCPQGPASQHRRDVWGSIDGIHLLIHINNLRLFPPVFKRIALIFFVNPRIFLFFYSFCINFAYSLHNLFLCHQQQPHSRGVHLCPIPSTLLPERYTIHKFFIIFLFTMDISEGILYNIIREGIAIWNFFHMGEHTDTKGSEWKDVI